MIDNAKLLLHCIGEINDELLEEMVQVKKVMRKKVIKYSALGIVAAGGLVLAYKLLKPRLTA